MYKVIIQSSYIYCKYYDMRYIFHVMHLLHLVQSAHFVCFEHKSSLAKNAVYPKQMGYTRQQTKQRIQEQITYILLYNILHYSIHVS